MTDRRLSSACACAIAAARAQEACEMWDSKLTQEDRIAIARRLRERREWRAVEIWRTLTGEDGI